MARSPEGALPVDDERIDDAVLALLHLTSYSEDGVWRAWKSHDWEALDRLHLAGMIGEPKRKSRSVVITNEGQERARLLYEQLVSGESALGIPRESARRGGLGTIPEEPRRRLEYVLDRFCSRLMKDASSSLEFYYRLRGSSAVLYQSGPAWESDEAIELPVARIRFDQKLQAWALDWRRSTERWESYVDFGGRRSLVDIVRTIDDDPDAVFFG